MNSFPFEKAELARYLAGYPAYAITNRYGNTPTDPPLAIEPIIQGIQDRPAFLDVLYEAMQVLARDAKYGWMVMYYVMELAWHEKRLGHQFILAEQITKIGKSLLANRKALIQEVGFDGGEFKSGVWNDVLRMNKNIADAFAFMVIPEDEL